MNDREFVLWLILCSALLVFALVAATQSAEAQEEYTGEGVITGTALIPTRGIFGIWLVERKTCAGYPVRLVPVGLSGEPREVICRHDGSFRFDRVEAGHRYLVETQVRWKLRNTGIEQGGWLHEYVHVSPFAFIHVELRGD